MPICVSVNRANETVSSDFAGFLIMDCPCPGNAQPFPGQEFHGTVHCCFTACILQNNTDFIENEIFDIDYLVKYCYNKCKLTNRWLRRVLLWISIRFSADTKAGGNNVNTEGTI